MFQEEFVSLITYLFGRDRQSISYKFVIHICAKIRNNIIAMYCGYS